MTVSTTKSTPDWMRVLRSLQAAGGRGICQADWNHPGRTPDGGPQIPQIARRIHDLKVKGHTIERRGKRDGFARYVLVRERWAPIETQAPPEPASGAAEQQPLVDAGQTSLLAGTPYDPFSEAA